MSLSVPASPAHSNPSSRPATPGSVSHDGETKGKIATLLSILRRFLGVSDLASVRFSLPASLMEPIPNLEYWNYLDYPDAFVQLGDPDDEIERCIAVLKFWFTKDLKFIKGKPCKPYNSTLGEFFRAQWEVPTSDSAATADAKPALVSFLTEQTSHHPPISAWYAECKEKGVTAKGYDQISAKFTGTSIRVAPGGDNLGIFINIESRDNEEWNLTHPAAHLSGLLTGSLSITVQDICYVTCPRLKIKVILHYLDESWVRRAQYKVEGVIFRYDPDDDTITRVRDVPEKSVLAKIDGSWVTQLYYTMAGSKERKLLVDVDPLFPAVKTVPPEELQLENESRKMWQEVTDAILSKDFGRAQTAKVAIEDQKRAEATDRATNNETWAPKYFVVGQKPGIPFLTPEGKDILENMAKREYKMRVPEAPASGEAST